MGFQPCQYRRPQNLAPPSNHLRQSRLLTRSVPEMVSRWFRNGFEMVSRWFRNGFEMVSRCPRLTREAAVQKWAVCFDFVPLGVLSASQKYTLRSGKKTTAHSHRKKATIPSTLHKDPPAQQCSSKLAWYWGNCIATRPPKIAGNLRTPHPPPSF